MTIDSESSFCWWTRRRLRYNVGLIVVGILAFIAYVFVGSTLLPADADWEITIFTTVFQSIGYLIMIGIANVFYFLGPLSEKVVSPTNPARYRRICYRFGFWFSMALPLIIPIFLAVVAIFHPEYWSHSHAPNL